MLHSFVENWIIRGKIKRVKSKSKKKRVIIRVKGKLKRVINRCNLMPYATGLKQKTEFVFDFTALHCDSCF